MFALDIIFVKQTVKYFRKVISCGCDTAPDHVLNRMAIEICVLFMNFPYYYKITVNIYIILYCINLFYFPLPNVMSTKSRPNYVDVVCRI
jgi:hypothetical protein